MAIKFILGVFLVVCGLLSPDILFAGYEEGYEAASKGLYSKAVSEFQKAADRGDARAQYSLGVMFREGIGVKKDLAKGNVLIQKAAENGHPLAKQVLLNNK